MSCAFIFPGQGSQKVGMASAFINGFSAGMKTIEEIEDAISFKISKIIEEGPIEELTKTENAQIAIFAATMACISTLEQELGYNIKKNISYLAGHSLGEYSALCVSGILSIHDASKIIRSRGLLMSKYCSDDKSDFAMVALLGTGVEKIEEIVKPFHSGRNLCVIANDNSPTQVVISGNRCAVKNVCEMAKTVGVEKAIELNTSGPFHSPLMASAAVEFDKVLAQEMHVNNFSIPVVMNLTAKPLEHVDDLHNMLVSHIVERVRWRDSINFIVGSGVKKLVEIGPGRTQSSMLKRVYPELNITNIETVAQMEEFVKSEQ